MVVNNLKKKFEEVETFIEKFANRYFFAKMYYGEIDANRFAALDQEIVDLSNQLGSALDIQVRTNAGLLSVI